MAYYLQLVAALSDIRRRAEHLAVRVGWALVFLAITAGFALAALGFGSFALYLTLIEPLGHRGAAAATALVLLVLAAITGLIMTRLLTTRRSRAVATQTPAPASNPLTLAIIALLGGLAAGSVLRRPRR